MSYVISNKFVSLKVASCNKHAFNTARSKYFHFLEKYIIVLVCQYYFWLGGRNNERALLVFVFVLSCMTFLKVNTTLLM